MDGSTILKETDGTKTITYYHGNGGVVGFNYNGTDYFFEKNLQGDVIALCDSSGSRLVEYVYDAWGKLLSMTDSTGKDISNDTTHIGYINPIRYRSYYYDVETKLYYLESRYYDPELGRFLNADSLDYLGDGSDLQNYNLYSYCENNPVMYSDPSGHSIETVFDVLSAVAGILEVAVNPADPLAWLGMFGDIADLVPFVTGLGETIRALKTASKFADGTDEAIDTYRNLRRLSRGTDLEAHHIIEKRFKLRSNIDIADVNDMLSVSITKDKHKVYTAKWRQKLKYGVMHDKKDVLKAAMEIYFYDTKLLAAAIVTIVN